MADSTLVTLKGLRSKLLASVSVSALVGQRIYNKAPQISTYPFVLLSCTSALDAVINTKQTFRHRIRCQAWSQVSLEEAVNIRAAIFNALHRQPVTLDSPFACIDAQVGELIDVFIEPDGKTYQSVIEFNLVVE
jgi:hypothetical protein